MEMQIREYQKQDFQPLKEIIRSTWHYDEFSSPETASRLAEVFLRSCLTNYTFSQVAVLDGTAAGIILVKNNKDHRCALSARFQQILSIVKLYASKEGRAVSQIFQNVNEIDRAGPGAGRRPVVQRLHRLQPQPHHRRAPVLPGEGPFDRRGQGQGHLL